MLREIDLPEGIPGKLYRAPMPGRWDWPLDRAMREIDEQGIDLVVSLATMREIRTEAPRYAAELEDESLPWETWDLPVPDGGIPEDEEEFLDLARDLAEELRDGANVLIHCYAGVGRTGTLAACTLMALGLGKDEALQAVEEAGAGPETYEQLRLVDWAARALRYDR